MMNQNPEAGDLHSLETPCLVLDEARMDRNIGRLLRRLKQLGVPLRPHLKTSKCFEVATRMMSRPTGPATVSTLMEAQEFAARGVRDILYAVGIAPDKLERVSHVRRQGIDLTVILDSVEQANAIASFAEPVPALIEIDCDGLRGGVSADNTALLHEIGRILNRGAALRGVMTHAGKSYSEASTDRLPEIAQQECAAAKKAADALRSAGLPCPVVSVGSTPTAHFVQDLTGVTEVRAGVFVFFDLFMKGVGVCTIDDIALSVLSTVIGHQSDRGWILIDAGWMALSRDRGTASQTVDQGYGVVCDASGRPFPDLIVTQANQEHGVVALRSGSREQLPDLPIGSRVRILPNHACATAAQHSHYNVIDSNNRVIAAWRRFSGW